jgi:hypothetical protein
MDSARQASSVNRAAHRSLSANARAKSAFRNLWIPVGGETFSNRRRVYSTMAPPSPTAPVSHSSSGTEMQLSSESAEHPGCDRRRSFSNRGHDYSHDEVISSPKAPGESLLLWKGDASLILHQASIQDRDHSTMAVSSPRAPGDHSLRKKGCKSRPGSPRTSVSAERPVVSAVVRAGLARAVHQVSQRGHAFCTTHPSPSPPTTLGFVRRARCIGAPL